jgi:hypothetical protein
MAQHGALEERADLWLQECVQSLEGVDARSRVMAELWRSVGSDLRSSIRQVGLGQIYRKSGVLKGSSRFSPSVLE